MVLSLFFLVKKGGAHGLCWRVSIKAPLTKSLFDLELTWGFEHAKIEDAVASVLGFIIFLGGVFLVFLFMAMIQVVRVFEDDWTEVVLDSPTADFNKTAF